MEVRRETNVFRKNLTNHDHDQDNGAHEDDIGGEDEDLASTSDQVVPLLCWLTD